MRELTGYEYDSSLPKIEASLEKKRRFVEEFFTTGEMGVAYLKAIDPDCPHSRARHMAQTLLETDKFVRDLMGVARKNVIGSITGLLAEHTSILAELRDEARADGKYAPAIAAEIARGKALGLYDRVNHNAMREKDPVDMDSNELNGLLDAVARLPSDERHNIAKMLMTDPSGGLLNDEEVIEGESMEVLDNED